MPLAGAGRPQSTSCGVKSGAAVADNLDPTAERLRHGRVERLAEQIEDVDGRPSAPPRAIDCITSLYQRGVITKEQLLAAEWFRESFRLAQLDPLRAPDLARVPGRAYREVMPGAAALRAQRQVQVMIGALGGIGRAPGSCAWHVIGLEWSVRRWAREWLGVNNPEATGVLIATCSLLDAIYSGRRSAA
jgi:hypothetical protein